MLSKQARRTWESKDSITRPGSAQQRWAPARFGSAQSCPPGGRTKAHIHENHESAFYVMSGDEVELWTGEDLNEKAVAHAGDYLYIPAGVPHVAVNRGATPALCVGARTDPNEQESVVMRPDLESRVP